MRIRMELETDAGRVVGGSIPVRDRASLKAAIARLAADIEAEAVEELGGETHP